MKKTNLDNVLSGPEVGRWEKIRLILSLSLPAILAQLTTIAMQYFDAAMAAELCFRGIIFLIRLYRGKWMKEALI